MRRLQQWRDRYETYLDSRPRVQPLDLLSHYLTEFQYGKFEDIEVPGQYSEASIESSAV
jgi:transformation/transcription domain-associated protein